jgi:hypothetical protein
MDPLSVTVLAASAGAVLGSFTQLLSKALRVRRDASRLAEAEFAKVSAEAYRLAEEARLHHALAEARMHRPRAQILRLHLEHDLARTESQSLRLEELLGAVKALSGPETGIEVQVPASEQIRIPVPRIVGLDSPPVEAVKKREES